MEQPVIAGAVGDEKIPGIRMDRIRRECVGVDFGVLEA
jgi:hypothetical protein